VAPGKRAPLTPALAEPWAVDGIPAMLDGFIGMQG
jgi:hypothetical protein